MENVNARRISSIRNTVENGKLITTVWMMNGDQYKLVNFRYTSYNGDAIEGRHYLVLNGITQNEYEMMASYLADNLKHCHIDFSRRGEKLEGISVVIEDNDDSCISADISADLNGDASTRAEFVEDVYWTILNATHMASYVNKPLYKIHAVSMKAYGVWPILTVCCKLFN